MEMVISRKIVTKDLYVYLSVEIERYVFSPYSFIFTNVSNSWLRSKIFVFAFRYEMRCFQFYYLLVSNDMLMANVKLE